MTQGPAHESVQARLKRRIRRVTESDERLVTTRAGGSLLARLIHLRHRERRCAGGVFACAVAFRLFLVLVPMILVLVAGIGFLHASDLELRASHELGFSQVLVDTVATVGDQADRDRWIVLGVGLSAAAVALRSLVATLRTTHMIVWETEDVGMLTKQVDLVSALGVATAIVGYVIAGQWMRANLPGGTIVASFVIGLGTTCVYLVVEMILPKAKGVSWRDLLPGAILVGIGTQALHTFTVLHFAGRIAISTQTYGPLGVAMVTLIWLYLLGRMMVLAAVLNADRWERLQLEELSTTAAGPG